MTDSFDAVELEILRTQLESVAEEMGDVLIRGAYSPNITERRDCSTAVFDAHGRLIAQAEHIPVHLGAMPDAVDAVLAEEPAPGETWILNDPFQGGTHLPDVTLVSAVPRQGTTVGYTVSRAHHADVGGSTPGSMPAGATDIIAEGLRIPPLHFATDDEIRTEILDLLLANVRNPEERRADFRAQLAANRRGIERLDALFSEHGDRLFDAFDAVIDYSRERVASELATLPDGVYTARDALEGDGITDMDIPIEAEVTIADRELTVDFEGTAQQVAGNVNAPRAVAKSAVYFVVRCLTDPDVPPNQGCYDPVTVRIPEGSLLDPQPPAAVVGGNVETSQRVTDVVFGALADAAPERVPAAGQGTMNNVIVGGPAFAYYETIGGGAGATATTDGLSGVQVGMTNTQNTPIEAVETDYPLRVTEYSIRRGSGGAGSHEGGDGLIRELELETAATVSLLTDRRRRGPPGLGGGGAGEQGRNEFDGEPVGAKITRHVDAGTTVRILTPGGGGHGNPSDSS